MDFVERLALCLLLCSGALEPTGPGFEHCLPAGIALSDVVAHRLTVAERLAHVGARCDAGQLVDGGGRPIRFYQLAGCWGNPPVDAQEILARQRMELEDLRRRHTVIEMTCSPDGDIRAIQ